MPRVAGKRYSYDKAGRSAAARARKRRRSAAKITASERKKKRRLKSKTKKRVCRFHGGKSTGPRTEQGRKRCAIAKTIHGRETRKKRTIRAERLRELREQEKILMEKGLILIER